MKIGLLLVIFFGLNSLVKAQDANLYPTRSLRASIGFARHGTGDVKGVIQGFEFEKYLGKGLSWSIEAGNSIHNGEYPEIYVDQNQQEHDISYRYTIAGMQVAGTVGYSFVRAEHINVGVKGGVIFRYQSSSMPNSLATYYPPGTGLPFPVILAENATPQKTFSPGGLIRLFLNYCPNSKYSFGLYTGFQGDTNGDTIFTKIAFSVGRTFK